MPLTETEKIGAEITQKLLYDTMVAVQRAVDELFKELGDKEAGDWGVINEGLLQLRTAIEVFDRKEPNDKNNSNSN